MVPGSVLSPSGATNQVVADNVAAASRHRRPDCRNRREKSAIGQTFIADDLRITPPRGWKCASNADLIARRSFEEHI